MLNHESEQRGNIRSVQEKKEESRRRRHLSQFGVVNEVRSVSVNEGAQSQAVLPTEPRQQDKREETWIRKTGKGRERRSGGRIKRQKANVSSDKTTRGGDSEEIYPNIVNNGL